MFAELSDEQLTALHNLLDEKFDRNRHEEGRVSPEIDQALSELSTGAKDEAYRRRCLPGGYETFWWARA